MKLKAIFAAVIVLIVAGVAYAATPQKSDDPGVAELRQTVTALNERITKLEARVSDMSTAKLRLIDQAHIQPKQR